RLSRGFRSRDRRQFRPDRFGKIRRDPGHSRGRTVFHGGVERPDRAGAKGDFRTGDAATRGAGGEPVSGFRLKRGDRLVLATHNKGKMAEFRDMLKDFGLDITSAGDLGLPEPEETGTTFVENARLKA